MSGDKSPFCHDEPATSRKIAHHGTFGVSYSVCVGVPSFRAFLRKGGFDSVCSAHLIAVRFASTHETSVRARLQPCRKSIEEIHSLRRRLARSASGATSKNTAAPHLTVPTPAA